MSNLIWSSEKYKAAGIDERQAMEVVFENLIRDQTKSKRVIMSQVYPGISNTRNYKCVELSFDNIYQRNGLYDLYRKDGEVFAVHRHEGPFLGLAIGIPTKFYNGDKETISEFMNRDF